ncbi:MFS transporter [Burkholderia sp. S171]|uniref:MFS transporter n=1 Tax=Burkholderia sp. S171 TaxID=1641860 RepID=UPI00131D777C|nr:MFS transporter [Burkholderia sp. S171]
MAASDYSAQTAVASRGNRWTIAWLLFIITIINYADRGVLGVVAPVLIKTFNLDIRQFGIIASAFGWGYVVMVFFGGGIVSWLGPKRTYVWFSVLWSCTISLVAVATGFASLFALRLLFGVSEGVVFPSGSQLIGNWFTKEEHGRAASLMGAGIPLGSLLVIPCAVWLTANYGWQAPFLLLGVVGIAWAVLCKLFVHDTPQAAANAQSGGAVAEHDAAPVPWGLVLRSQTLWLTGLAFFSSAYVLYFLLNFLPTWLVRERHIEFAHVSFLGILPWVSMTAGALLSGPVSDFVYRRTQNLRWARSYLAGACLILTGAIISLTLILSDTYAIVALISVASFINFIANPVFFAIPIDACPEHGGAASSLTTGIGSTAGIVAPLFTGFIVHATGTFYMAFALVSILPIVFGVLLIVACNPAKL